MTICIFFVGSYTDTGSPAPNPIGAGISSCSFDSVNGSIIILGSYFQRNPSYPIVSADGTVLYAAEEMFAAGKPLLVSYKIQEDGSLIKLNEMQINGDYACHLAIAGQTILVANYVSSDILVYALEVDGSIGQMVQHIQHHGSGVNKDRQEAPHPHMIYALDDHTAYCVDSGIDTAKAYCANPITGKWEPFAAMDIAINKGAGARHMDIDPDKKWMALIGELSGELFLFRYKEGQFHLADSAYLGMGEMSAAAIRIHTNSRFVYCSERMTNSIHAFQIVDDHLHPVGVYYSGGATPRDIVIDPGGNWLLAANQDDDSIAVFSINNITGELAMINKYPVTTPSCICWQTVAW